MSAQQISEKVKSMWSDPLLKQRIEDGIRTNRMGDFTLKFVDEKGQSVEVENLKIEQTKHEFLFGANAFMNKGFPSESDNEKYEKTFASLFNFASLPFYWNTIEPKEGELRFAKDSKPIYRRPAPDLVLEFCDKYGIIPKGHTLVWDDKKFFIPDWLPENTVVREKALAKRIDQIAERYNDKIKYWDVANEPSDKRRDILMPNDFFFKGFKEAERVFSADNKFIINLTPHVWERPLREYGAAECGQDYLIVENTILKKAKVDIIGLQMHFISESMWKSTIKGEVYTPDRILYILDLFSRFNLPIHITEYSNPAYPEGEIGEQNQAFLAENIYKLLFSYPAIEAITWWNIVDKTAPLTIASDNPWESSYNLGGIVNRDFSPKPSYKALDRLINKEWKTNLAFSEKHNFIKVKCFYGAYKITYQVNGKSYSKNVSLSKNGFSKQTISIQ